MLKSILNLVILFIMTVLFGYFVMLNIVKEMQVKQKYRLGNKNAMELGGGAINEQERKWLAITDNYTGIHLQNMPDKVRTKQSNELNFYVPEKWIY